MWERVRPQASVLRFVPSSRKCELLEGPQAGGRPVDRVVPGDSEEDPPARRLYPNPVLQRARVAGVHSQPGFLSSRGQQAARPPLASRGQQRTSVWAWLSLTLLPNGPGGLGLGPQTRMRLENETSPQTSRSSLTSRYRESAGRGVVAKPAVGYNSWDLTSSHCTPFSVSLKLDVL